MATSNQHGGSALARALIGPLASKNHAADREARLAGAAGAGHDVDGAKSQREVAKRPDPEIASFVIIRRLCWRGTLDRRCDGRQRATDGKAAYERHSGALRHTSADSLP